MVVALQSGRLSGGLSRRRGNGVDVVVQLRSPPNTGCTSGRPTTGDEEVTTLRIPQQPYPGCRPTPGPPARWGLSRSTPSCRSTARLTLLRRRPRPWSVLAQWHNEKLRLRVRIWEWPADMNGSPARDWVLPLAEAEQHLRDLDRDFDFDFGIDPGSSSAHARSSKRCSDIPCGRSAPEPKRRSR